MNSVKGKPLFQNLMLQYVVLRVSVEKKMARGSCNSNYKACYIV